MAAVHPIGADEFDRLMAPLGPFERPPTLAVAVSGGADSRTLATLADDWARRRGGAVAALIVDHGLRPDSAAEASRVAGWLAAEGIAATVLAWRGPKPSSDVQAAARAARYRLLDEWCRAAGVLHLLLAHHRDDQAETLLLRLARGSGLDGLAAMAPVTETPALRILRPLLGVPGPRLRATAKARGLPWVEDPSNRDPAFARARMRALAPKLAAEGVTAQRLAATAAALGGARRALEGQVARFLAAAATIHSAAYCWLDPARYVAADEEVARRALVRVILCVGGAPYPPRAARVARLHAALRAGALAGGRTLGGCRILPRRGHVLICREDNHGDAAFEGDRATWGGAFTVVRAAAASRQTVRRLGRDGWANIAALQPRLRDTPIPAAARPGLPAVCDLDGIVAVPHLGFVREDLPARADEPFGAAFRPRHSLCPPAFAFVAGGE